MVLEVPVLIVVGIGLSLNTENLFLSDTQTSISMTESITEVFFQLAGTQRLEILLNLRNQDCKMSNMAKKLDSTLPVPSRYTRSQQAKMAAAPPPSDDGPGETTDGPAGIDKYMN